MTSLIYEAALRILLHRNGPNAPVWYGEEAVEIGRCVALATTLYAKTVEATKETG